MAKLFILPKRSEVTNIKNFDNQNSNDFYLLNPNDVFINSEISYPTIEKIIRLHAQNEREIYFLYHVGNLTNIDNELKAKIPRLICKMYTNIDTKNYKTIRDLIESIANNNVTMSMEGIIRQFFLNKELEAALRLLHECLDPKIFKKIIWEDFEVTNSEAEIKFEILKNKSSDQLETEFLKALKDLRDDLLPE